MEITRYGDIGTPQRHAKFGGVVIAVIDGQELATVGATDYLDAFLKAGIFNQDQYNSTYQLIRDYQVGFLFKWKIVKEYCRAAGLPCETADIEREEARRNYNAALRYNPEFSKLSDIAHLLLEHVGVYIPPPWKLRKLADRLTNFYCNHQRIVIE